MNQERYSFDLPDPDTVRMMRAMSGAERLRTASGMYASARRMLLAHLKSLNPGWAEERVQAEAARRLGLGAG